MEQQYKLPNPFSLCTNLICLQAEMVWTCIFNAAAPFFSVISLVSGFFHQRPPTTYYKEEEEEELMEPIIMSSSNSGSGSDSGGGGGVGVRIAVGLVAAAYVCLVLMVLMVVAAVLGIALVRAWAEQPLYVKENLQFDYRDAHPTALFSLPNNNKYNPPVGVAHTLYVSLLLLMPESDYNTQVGIFQLSAELLSFEHDEQDLIVITKSSHPCMLQFRSWPVRLARTFIMGVPLLLGITTETQRITFPMLRHKEAPYPRTQLVRITLAPRAGTSYLPQFYHAQLLIRSRPPWIKELIYRWKWTFCVWTTMHIFIMLVIMLSVFFLLKPRIRQGEVAPPQQQELLPPRRRRREEEEEETEVSESLRRWQRTRSKRKAALIHLPHPTFESSTASSISGFNYPEEQSSGDSESSSPYFR